MFTHGFNKVAFAPAQNIRSAGRALGRVGEKGVHGVRSVLSIPYRLAKGIKGTLGKGIQEGATASALARKGIDYGDIGKGVATTKARRALERKAVRLEGKLTPQTTKKIQQQLSKTPPEATPELKQKIITRAKSMKAAGKKVDKPSFAQRHPYLTAGGAFLAGSYALGGPKEPQAAQSPQITYGNY